MRVCEMAFGKRKDGDDASDPDDVIAMEDDVDDFEGPFDIDDFDDPSTAGMARLDLGSVLIPMPEAGQVQAELTEMGVPSAVWVVTPNGRFTVAAYAAPKTAGLWREVAAELADSLRKDVPTVRRTKSQPWPPKRGMRWRTLSFGAARRRCRSVPRWRCNCPSRWRRSCARRPKNPPSSPNRHSSPTSSDQSGSPSPRET